MGGIMSDLLKKMKVDLHKAMKREVEMRKNNTCSGTIYEACMAVKDVVRTIISMFPEIGLKPDQASDDNTIQLLKKYVTLEKTRELYLQHILSGTMVIGLSSKELSKLQKQKLAILGNKLTSMKISIAESYLPKEIGEAEIIDWITDNIDFSKLKNNMQAIGLVKKHFGEAVNPILVRNIVESWFK